MKGKELLYSIYEDLIDISLAKLSKKREVKENDLLFSIVLENDLSFGAVVFGEIAVVGEGLASSPFPKKEVSTEEGLIRIRATDESYEELEREFHWAKWTWGIKVS